MLTMQVLLVLCVVIVIVGGEGNRKFESLPEHVKNNFSASVASFTLKCAKEMIDEKPGSSMVFSALSLEPLLAQLSLASEGDSRDQILKTLGFPNDTFTQDVFPMIFKDINETKGVTLNLATKFFFRQDHQLHDDFKKMTSDLFNSEIQHIDFSKNAAVARRINSWVADKTHTKFENIVNAKSISPSANLILCNALYFKGTWIKKFDGKLTQNRVFYLANDKGKIMLPTMTSDNVFGFFYSRKLCAKILELPYQGGEAKLVIVLPHRTKGIPYLIKRIKHGQLLVDEVSKLTKKYVHVELPKFRIETAIDITGVLKKLGITNVFNHTHNALTKVVKTTKGVTVSQLLQKICVEVSEEGTEAAKSNAWHENELELFGNNESANFIANHPFMFYIVKGSIILFGGVFCK